jgi:hypothetical protein
MTQHFIRNISKNADGWYWEVIAQDRVVARGIADSPQQAEDDAGKVEASAAAWSERAA